MNKNGHEALVVEDDPEINQLVGAYVELCGLRYRPAPTGEAALDAVRNHRPAIVLLDLMLPDIDGVEICRRLKDDPETADIPVIILTALNNGESRRQLIHCGAAEYLTKPFDPDRLIQAIHKHLGAE